MTIPSLARRARSNNTFRSVLLALAVAAPLLAGPLGAQPRDAEIIPVTLPIGRSYPIEAPVAVSRVSVANPDVADVAVVGERDVVINARAVGETDVLLWGTGMDRRHYRVKVQSTTGARRGIVLGVKFAEVRRDLLRNIGISGLYRDDNVRIGTGAFRTDNVFDDKGNIKLDPGTSRYLTVLSNFGTDDVLGLIDAEAVRGNATILAEPNVMAADGEQASFLAGGELPIPVASGSVAAGGAQQVTILWREFGVRLNFLPEIINDSLIKLRVAPEVSSLDFANAIVISGFRIPALRSRKLESTVDVRQSQSLVISGLFNTEREKVRTGIPFLMDIPVLGNLFSSTRWMNNESELVIIVTPMIVDPLRARPQDVRPVRPDTALPAREALGDRLQPVPAAPVPAQSARPQPPASQPRPSSQPAPPPSQSSREEGRPARHR